MTKKFGKKAAMVMLSATLLGGVFVTVPNALTTTTAQASAKISYAEFKDDVAAAKSAVKLATPAAQQILNSKFFTKLEKNPTNAYNVNASNSFVSIMTALCNDGTKNLDSDGHLTTESTKDWKAIQALSNHFIGEFTSNGQSTVQDAYDSIVANDGDGWTDYDGFPGYQWAFSQGFDGAFNGVKVTGIPSTPKSYISKLSAKKTSKKYVKVSGSAKLYKSANYAHIKTYKGYRYAKLNSKHNFSKSIYAPKAKTVKVTVGHYANGHYKAVTSTKTVHVK
ncbi:hypothetical protein [Secundilactobacillus odoratitofui]|nr:hypothetical protein [Secundilactobacillus odoratitofui]